MLAEYELNRERNEDLFVSAGEDNVCPVHFHRKVEVMYVTSGVKNFVAAGKEVSLGEDGIFFANSYEMHGYVESAGSTQTVIVFPNRMLGNYYDCFGDKMPLGNMVTDKEFCRTLLPHFEALAAGGENRLLVQARCDFILGSLMDKLGTVEGVKERQSFVDGLLAYINENYAEDIDLESMAEHFGYSKYYFSRMFSSNEIISISSTGNFKSLCRTVFVIIQNNFCSFVNTPVCNCCNFPVSQCAFQYIRSFRYGYFFT